MELDKEFEVRYSTLDFNGKNWIVRTKNFYFKDEAIEFSKRMEKETKLRTAVYEKTIKYERIA